ncbi:MAG: DUF1801 domain-containing protein, partial [Vallitaleaceae bacterium]|nr:DUF1801 domain-containing protein [Vallitaleaceae bacterium]
NEGYKSMDDYISRFSPAVQDILNDLRKMIHENAPDATEKISYQMPTFDLYGNLVHFAAYENHIGFYPTPTGLEAFADEIAQYKKGKGSIQFPIDQPLPVALITGMVKMRVVENLQREAERKNKKKKK